MGITTIFGINGIGKDTIAEELRKKNKELKVTSMSRLSMYLLGISTTYDVREKITEEQYKELEMISQTKMIELENNEYREHLEKMAKSDEDVIILSHLISALRLGDKTEYLTERKTPKWFIDINQNLIQLVAPADLISDRRSKDKTRKRDAEIEQIIKHQSLCNKEWERIAQENVKARQKMHIVENINLDKAIKEIENIVYARKNSNIEYKNKFIDSLEINQGNISTNRNIENCIKENNMKIKGGKESER